MTAKQMYSELAKIAGARCATGATLVQTSVLTERELKKAQKSLLALLDKLNYSRTARDFGLTEGAMARYRSAEINIDTDRIRRRAQEVSFIETTNAGVLMQGDPSQFSPMRYQPFYSLGPSVYVDPPVDPAWTQLPAPEPETREENNP